MADLDLRAVREEIGASQLALSDVLGVAQSTVRNWELGLHPVPAEVRERWEDACREAVQAVGKRSGQLDRGRKYRAVSGG